MNHPSSSHGTGSGGPDVVVVIDIVVVEDVDDAVVELVKVDEELVCEVVDAVLVDVEEVIVDVDVVDDNVTGSLQGRQFSASSLSTSPGPETQH